jgi:hypothetical protein
MGACLGTPRRGVLGSIKHFCPAKCCILSCASTSGSCSDGRFESICTGGSNKLFADIFDSFCSLGLRIEGLLMDPGCRARQLCSSTRDGESAGNTRSA